MRPGFSVIALCCLVIDTLQSFHEGGRSTSDSEVLQTPRPSDNRRTTRAFKDFLRRSKHFNAEFSNSEIQGDFTEDVRNGILHEAETRGGWLIERTRPERKIVERISGKGGYVLNRTNFYEALCREFDDYLAQLYKESEEELRRNFIKKMDEICESEPRRGKHT